MPCAADPIEDPSLGAVRHEAQPKRVPAAEPGGSAMLLLESLRDAVQPPGSKDAHVGVDAVRPADPVWRRAVADAVAETPVRRRPHCADDGRP